MLDELNTIVLIVIDECGDEREVDRFRIADDLDEDYLEMWKSLKIEKARERYPEARGFYFEDRRLWKSSIQAAVHEFFGDYGYEEDEDEWEEEEDEASHNMPCDTYGMCACMPSCPLYYKCNS